MMREMMAAVAFLTRVPVTAGSTFTPAEIGRSARWFPLVGMAIGGVFVVTARIAGMLFPPALAGLLVVLVEVVLTGALHMDGLADMADGFGGGKTREDVLNIMRGHAIGAYGAAALILLIAVKAVSIGVLLERSAAEIYLVVTPAIGRWSAVGMAALQPYARPTPGPIDSIGRAELCVATVIAAFPCALLLGWFSIAFGIAALGTTAAMSVYSKRRIGGVTGDTLGANVEVVEAVALLAAVAVSR